MQLSLAILSGISLSLLATAAPTGHYPPSVAGGPSRSHVDKRMYSYPPYSPLTTPPRCERCAFPHLLSRPQHLCRRSHAHHSWPVRHSTPKARLRLRRHSKGPVEVSVAAEGTPVEPKTKALESRARVRAPSEAEIFGTDRGGY